MRKKLDLSTRHLTFTEFNGKTAQVTVTEDGYKIRFVENPLPTIKGLPFTDKVRIAENTAQERGLVVTYKGNKNIFFGHYLKQYRRIGKKVFPSTSWLYAIRYDGKRIIKTVSSTLYNHTELANLIFRYFGIECILYTYNKDYAIAALMGSKTVLKAICQQKVTNARDLTRVYLQAITGIKTMPSYETAAIYIQNLQKYELNLVDLANFTTSFEKSMLLEIGACENNRQYVDDTDLAKRYRIFRDLVRDAVKLDIKVNPDWSLKRMEEEHQRNTERIMLETEQKLSDEQLYKSPTDIEGQEIKGTVLSTEKQVYREAAQMHHCLYNHYFYSIQQGKYLALSLTKPERCTVGLCLKLSTGDDGEKSYDAVLEQIHTIRNGCVTPESRAIIANFVAGYNPQLTEMMNQAGKQFGSLTAKRNGTVTEIFPPVIPEGIIQDEDDIPF